MLSGGRRQVVGIKSNEGQLRTIVSSGKTMGAPNQVSPRPREFGGFMDMSVQGEQRLAAFNKAPDGNAAHMRIERDVINHLAFQPGQIERSFIRGGMEKKDSFVHTIITCQAGEIILNSGVTFFLVRDREGTDSLFGGNAAQIDKARNIISFPIF